MVTMTCTVLFCTALYCTILYCFQLRPRVWLRWPVPGRCRGEGLGILHTRPGAALDIRYIILYYHHYYHYYLMAGLPRLQSAGQWLQSGEGLQWARGAGGQVHRPGEHRIRILYYCSFHLRIRIHYSECRIKYSVKYSKSFLHWKAKSDFLIRW